MKKGRKGTLQIATLNRIVLMSAWSFIMVISSFLFLFAGRWIDVRFNTEPTFMLGLFVLGICLCIGRMYTEYIKTRDELDKRKVRYQS
ncbi:MAG: AtpZ/AtpI family protein [Desulfomonilia bacterium]|nr:AtpZ/AtpI family protein [Desulfomonilia bacterium]